MAAFPPTAGRGRLGGGDRVSVRPWRGLSRPDTFAAVPPPTNAPPEGNKPGAVITGESLALRALSLAFVLRRDAGLYGYERALRRAGFGLIAGADEAGRGACAGPLVAASVILGSPTPAGPGAARIRNC